MPPQLLSVQRPLSGLQAPWMLCEVMTFSAANAISAAREQRWPPRPRKQRPASKSRYCWLPMFRAAAARTGALGRTSHCIRHAASRGDADRSGRLSRPAACESHLNRRLAAQLGRSNAFEGRCRPPREAQARQHQGWQSCRLQLHIVSLQCSPAQIASPMYASRLTRWGVIRPQRATRSMCAPVLFSLLPPPCPFSAAQAGSKQARPFGAYACSQIAAMWHRAAGVMWMECDVVLASLQKPASLHMRMSCPLVWSH